MNVIFSVCVIPVFFSGRTTMRCKGREKQSEKIYIFIKEKIKTKNTFLCGIMEGVKIYFIGMSP